MLPPPVLANNLIDAVFAIGQLWRLWLPLLVGAAAIYLLLPRPRSYPVVWGVLAGVTALLLAGGLLVRAGAVTAEAVLFYAFSGIAIAAAALLVTQQNPARAALSFALVILSTCGLFLLLGAPFLAAATIIIYAGAIIVTFLFVLMLAQQLGRSDADSRSREPLLATITGFVLLATILYVLRLGYDTRDLDEVLSRVHEAAAQETAEGVRATVGDADSPVYLFKRVEDLMKAQGWKDLRDRAESASWLWPFDPKEPLDAHQKPIRMLEAVVLEGRDRLGMIQPPVGLSLSALSGTPASTPAAELRRNQETRVPELPADNAAYLGRSLFADFLLPVELGGLLLLVATIGAIAIAQHKGERHVVVPALDVASGRPAEAGTPAGGNV